MVTTERDLWPSTISESVDVNTPDSVLRGQASLLGKKTGGLVRAEVRLLKEHQTHVSLPGDERIEVAWVHAFYLSAPALDYRYLLFSLLQPVEMYPLYLKGSPIGDIKIESEEAFLAALKEIFSSEKTRRVVQSLIAQSASEKESSARKHRVQF